MRGLPFLWGGLVLVFAAFLSWHTSFKGPLTEAEIEAQLRALEALPRDAEAVPFDILSFLRSDDGRPFYMVNLDALTAGEAAAASDQAYGQVVVLELLRRGSYPALMAMKSYVIHNDFGEKVASFDRLGVVRYRSRRDFLNLLSSERFAQNVEHKWAALDGWITAPSRPILDVGLTLVVTLVLVSIGSIGSLGLVLRSRAASAEASST